MDVHVRRAVTVALRLREVDVLTAQEDGSQRLADPELLDRATALDRVLFSQDRDLLREARIVLHLFCKIPDCLRGDLVSWGLIGFPL